MKRSDVLVFMGTEGRGRPRTLEMGQIWLPQNSQHEIAQIQNPVVFFSRQQAPDHVCCRVLNRYVFSSRLRTYEGRVLLNLERLQCQHETTLESRLSGSCSNEAPRIMRLNTLDYIVSFDDRTEYCGERLGG